MVRILEVNNLNYHDLKNINLSFERKMFYTIVGGNNSGKTTLFRLITGIIPTTDYVYCDGIYLNNDSINQYIKKIGIVERVNNNSFIYQKVYDEMTYPLYNLGFNIRKRNNRIREVLHYFNLDDFLDKNINELNNHERQLLLIMLAILHKPKVLLLDSVLEVFNKDEKEEIITVLKRLIIDENLTIINFTSNLTEIEFSDKLVLLSHFKVLGEYLKDEIYHDDKLFYQNGLEIPFMADLSNKLKIYGVINKNYTDMEEMVNDIWP